MIRARSLVRPLEAAWEPVLDAALAALAVPGGARALGDVAKLGPRIAELSRAYNAGEAEGRRTKLPLDARLAFSFPRDVPKGAGAVRELVAAGLLALPADRPLRVLDLGAGLGAMTWGIARAIAAAGGEGRIEALLVDEDPAVLAAAEAIARAARTLETKVPLAVTTRTAPLASFVAKEKADVVVLGQVLSELAPGADPEARLAEQQALIERLLATAVLPDGALVVVEPALRARTRHLHALRDRLVGAGRTVFAPCLHQKACPTLPIEDAWCHEDLGVDLPPWVVPLARAAGLRWQGLTFSYLVLRPDGATMDASAAYRFRVVSDLIPSKGKTELFGCTALGDRVRLRRLDRDAGKETGAGFETLRRGDVVGLGGDPPVDDRGRLNAQVSIDVGHLRR